MSLSWGPIAGVLIVLMMALFLGIWFWAWRARHHDVFTRMARLPLEDCGDPRNRERQRPAQDVPS